MTSTPPLERMHPEMRRLIATDLQARKDYGVEILSDDKLLQFRDFARAQGEDVPPATPVHRVEDRRIPGDQNDINIRIYHPSDQKNLPVLMWFHGGGWVLGTLDDADDICRKFSRRVGCIVISVDYHLAPEARFPVAVNDCFAATRWVADHAGEIDADASRIAVAGASAGGNLAACTAIQCRDCKLPIIFQFLLVPVIDTDFERPSYQACAEGCGLTRADMRWFWDCYVPDENERRNPLASPIHADDLSGLPPALVITAECDPLCDDGAAYARALESADVSTEYCSYPGMIHGFFNSQTEAPVVAVEQSFALTIRLLKSALSLRETN